MATGGGEGREAEDETKGCLLGLMCDKCSQLGEFSCSLEQVIIQGLLLARPCPTLYRFTCNQHCAFPPKPLSQPPFDAYPLGKTDIEQLLFNCNISAKTTCRVFGWKGVGIKTYRPPEQEEIQGGEYKTSHLSPESEPIRAR